MQYTISLILIITFSFFSANYYNVAMPDISLGLNMTTDQVQSTFSIYYVGNVIAAVWCAVFADNLGKKNVLYLLLSVGILASAVCLFASTYEVLYWGRFFQGLGNVVGMMIGLAVANDLYSKAEFPRFMGKLTLGITLAIISPAAIIGLLTDLIHWRSAFAIIFAFGLCVLFLSYSALPDSVNDQTKQTFRGNIRDIGKILRNRNFVAAALLNPLQIASMFFVGTLAPFYFQVKLGYSASLFGTLWSLSFISMAIGGAVSNYYHGKVERITYLNYCVFVGLIAPTLMCFIHFLYPTSIYLTFSAIFIFNLFGGATLPVSISMAMEAFPQMSSKTASLRAILVFGAMYVGSNTAYYVTMNNILIYSVSFFICLILFFLIQYYGYQHQTRED